MEERKMILKMVEEGKINAEDGAKLLKAIGDEEQKSTSTSTVRKHTSEPRSTSDSKELSTSVNWDEGNRRHDEFYREQESQTGEKESPWSESTRWFTEFVESAVQKIKELDLDFNFGTSEEVHHIFQHKNMTETFFELSLENGSIEIEPWDEEDVKIDCRANVYKAENEEDARRIFLTESVFESVDNELQFYTKTKKVKMDAKVYVPRKSFDKLKVYTFNGHIALRNLQGTSLSAKTVNGSLQLDQLRSKVLEAETVNGPIDLNGGKNERVDLRTVHGMIEIDGQVTDVDAESVNGSVNARFQGDQDIRAGLAATTGSVYVSVPAGVRTDGKLKTNVGNYHWKLENVEVVEEKRDFIQKSLKLVSNPQASPVIRVEAGTKTGSVTLKTHDAE